MKIFTFLMHMITKFSFNILCNHNNTFHTLFLLEIKTHTSVKSYYYIVWLLYFASFELYEKHKVYYQQSI
jgi:hypothetical protein